MTPERNDVVIKALNELTAIGSILGVMAEAQLANMQGLSAFDVKWLAEQMERTIIELHAAARKGEPRS